MYIHFSFARLVLIYAISASVVLSAKVALQSATQINGIFNTPADEGGQGVKLAVNTLTLKQTVDEYNQMSCDLLNIDRYGNVTCAEYETIWRLLLVDLAYPGMVDKLLPLIANGTKEFLPPRYFDTQVGWMLYEASSYGLPVSNDTASHIDAAKTRNLEFFTSGLINFTPVLLPQHAEAMAKNLKNYEQDRKQYLIPFCSTLGHGNKQFLIANSTRLTQEGSARVRHESSSKRQASQDAIVLSVLELCKAHLGLAPTITCSLLITTWAMSMVVLYCT